MKTDIVLLLYNRPVHSLAVIDSLIQNGVSRVRAFMDFADTPEVAQKQEQLLEEIEARDQIDVHLHRHTRRLGLAGSVRFALDVTLADADAAILLEDDCVVQPGGIEFFNQGLERLQDDRRVRSVCGYLFPCAFVQTNGEPLLLRRFSSWGWATWRDRWHSHESDLSATVDKLEAAGVALDDVAGDLAELCRSRNYLDNRVDVWSVSWALEHYLTNTFAVYPSGSVITNIGFDGTGQHCLPSGVFETGTEAQPRAWDWSHMVHHAENDEILKRFMDEHGKTIYPGP